MPATPLSIFRANVAQEHIDYNGHMNVAYYVLLFDQATDAYKVHVGLDTDYRERTNCSTFAAELHVTYLKELKLGDPVRVETLLLNYDAKRHHFIHSMYNDNDGSCCALMEVMSLHVDLGSRRVKPFPEPILTRIHQLHEDHLAIPRPEQTGHVMAIAKKAPPENAK